jgi:hypothetical protein
MSNHKWSDNVCTKCGISRERKEYRKWQRSYTYLSKSGVWEDRDVYTFGTAWHYGKGYGFKRPQCAIVMMNSISITK